MSDYEFKPNENEEKPEEPKVIPVPPASETEAPEQEQDSDPVQENEKTAEEKVPSEPVDRWEALKEQYRRSQTEQETSTSEEKKPESPNGPNQAPPGGYSGPNPGYWEGQPPYAGQPQGPYQPYGQYPPNQQGGMPYQTNPSYGYQNGPQQSPQYPQYPSQYPPHPPQKPEGMGRGVKVFLIVMVSIAALFIVAFCGVGIYFSLNEAAMQPDDTSSSSSEEQPPESSDPGIFSEDEDSPAVSAPQGDVTDPDGEGLTIVDRPSTPELSANEVYEEVAPSIVCVLSSDITGSGTGSGVIATEDGYILTNAHVINNSKDTKVRILLYDGGEYDAAIVGFDKVTDLAVLKIDAEGLKAATFGNSDQLLIGDWVLALGSPSGVEYASSLSRGVVSGLNRTVSYSDANNMTYIQTDAAINPGNSGGALVNMYGQVVGINSSKISGVSYEGLSFSIPMNKAKPILDDLMQLGYVSGRPRLGITARTVSAMDQMYGKPAGVEIAEIEATSPFSATEAQPGDIITGADGRQITSLEELYQILGIHSPGDKLELTLNRNGREFTITVELMEDAGQTQETQQIPSNIQ